LACAMTKSREPACTWSQSRRVGPISRLRFGSSTVRPRMRTEQRASKPGETGQRLKGEVIPMERLAVASAVLVVLVGFGGCARDGDTNPAQGQEQ
jgi:hypothetical protein